MASVDWQKSTIGAVASMSAHFDNERRKAAEHSNKDIDVTKTDQNVTIGGSFGEVVTRLKERVAELDAKNPPKRIRSDRKTALLLEVKVPQQITDAGKAEDFCRAAFSEIEKNLGKGNAVGAFIHLDEVHDYYDARSGTVKTSLVHMHVVAVPVANGRVNAKECQTRARMKSMNAAIDKLCMERYNCHYLTGEEQESGVSVEKLKAQTAKAVMARDFDKELAEKKAQMQQYENLVEKPKLPAGRKTLVGDKTVYNASDRAEIEKQVLAAQNVLKQRDDVTEREKRVSAREQRMSNLEKSEEEAQKEVTKYIYLERPQLQQQIEDLKNKVQEQKDLRNGYKELANKTFDALSAAVEQLPQKKRVEIAKMLLPRDKNEMHWSAETIKGLCEDKEDYIKPPKNRDYER